MNKSWWTLGIALLAVAGCNGGSSSSSSPDSGVASSATGGGATKGGDGNRLSIAVIPKGTTHEYWKSVHEGAQNAATELGVDIIWKGPLKEDDRSSQIDTVEGFISKRVSGIVLAPLDDKALANPVEEATKNNIPVVIFDSALKSTDQVSFVSTNNEKGGQIAGEQMAKVLNKKGSIIVLRYAEGSASTEDREKGFLEAIAKYPDIKVVSSNQYGGATTESAQKASENLLAPYRQGDKLSVDGIFCPNESTTFGMLRSLQEQGFAGKVHFVGFDFSQKLKDALMKSQIDALVVQNPRKMGYLSVKTLVAKLRGEKVEPQIDTGATLITKDNIDSKENAELLAPPKI